MATVPIELIMVEMECSVREPVCHYIQIKLLLGSYPHAGCMLEQVLWTTGRRRSPSWMRDKARERRNRTFRETPAEAGGCRSRRLPFAAALRCTARGSCCWSIKWTPNWLPFRPDAGATIALALRGIVRSALLPYAGAAVPAILFCQCESQLISRSNQRTTNFSSQEPSKNLNRWAGI